jgi:hypothetical protein
VTLAAILLTVAIISTTPASVVLWSTIEVATAASTTSTLAATSTTSTLVASSTVTMARAAGVDIAFASHTHGATVARAGVVTRARTGEVQVPMALLLTGAFSRVTSRLSCVLSRVLIVVTCVRSDVC